MSSVTPSTALTTCRERRNKDPLARGKWTFRSLIEINGCAALSITWRTGQRPRLRNDRANNVRALVVRTAETPGGRVLRRAHIAAQRDNPAASAPRPAAIRVSGKDCL